MNRLKSRICIFVFLFAMIAVWAIPANAQTPFAMETELYYETNLSDAKTDNIMALTYSKLADIEPLQPLLGKIKKRIGIDPEKDIFSWIGSNIRFGIVGERGRSPLHDSVTRHVKMAQAKKDLLNTVSAIRNYRTAVELYLNEKGKLPDKKGDLFPKHILKEKKLPRGGYVIYKKLKDRQYVLMAPKNQFTDLGLKGNLPKYHSVKGFKGNYSKKSTKFELTDWLLVIQVKDSTKARAFFNKLEKMLAKDAPGKGITFKKKISGLNLIRQSRIFSYTFKKQMVLIADKPHVLERAFYVMKRPHKSLSSNKVFNHYYKKSLNHSGIGEKIFINLHRININSKVLNIKNKTLAPLVDGLYYLGYSGIVSASGVEAKVDLQLDPDAVIPVMETYAKTRPNRSVLMENLPAGLQVAVVYNFGEVLHILNSVAKHEKGLAKKIKLMTTRFAMVMGMDMEKDVFGATTGEVGVSYKFRDLLFGMFLARNRSGSRRSTTTTKPKRPKLIPEAMPLSKRKLRRMMRFSGIPMTLFFQVKDKENLERVIEKAGRRAKFKQMYYQDVTIHKSRKLYYCFTERLLMLHTFPSATTLKKYIDRLQVQRQRLGETTHYRDFKKRIPGRPIMIQYQDSRWMSSMARGFMMLMLPEFEDYTDRFINFKESWSALSVNPKGVQIYFKSYNEKAK